jgi:methanethiol S-methyltransferase
MGEYINLIAWWMLFFAVHSIMASSQVKKKIDQINQIYKAYYRLAFNIVSFLLLVPVIYSYQQTPTRFMFASTTLYDVVGSLIVLAGIYIAIAGFKNYRADEFIGTYQIKNNHDFHPAKLSRNSWNGVVRHPMYFGSILLVAGILLLIPTIKLGITGVLIVGYLYIGTLWEEKKLVSEFDAAYKEYKREVSMLIPIKWIANKFRRF